MDLWDVIKVMVRRWAVAVPLLLVTVAGSVWTATTVAPEYTATTKVGLLSPVESNNDPSKPVNPWDPQGLTLAALSRINSKALHEEYEARGHTEVWTADLDMRSSSLILIEVTADSPQAATAVAVALQGEVKREVEDRQAVDPRLSEGRKYTTVTFDNGDDIEATTTKLKRTLIVVAGVGLIITIGATIAIDALLRRRGRRLNENWSEPVAMAGAHPPTPSPTGGQQRPSAVARGSSARQAASASTADAGAVGRPPAARTHVVPPRTAPITNVVATEATRVPEPPTSPGLTRQDEDTSTIVLPLTNPLSQARDRRGPGGRGADGSR